MWTRETLKSNAKNILKTSYWYALVVSTILAVTSGSSGGASSTTTTVRQLDYRLAGAIILVAAFGSILVLAFRIFVGNPLEVSGKMFFLQNIKKDTSLNYLLFSFKEGRYLNILKTMFIRNLLIFLWTLLFIIPGIIKSYAYRMVPYILAENPDIEYLEAIKISEKMTLGHKMDIFVLDLSFIGWYLLGLLACGIGIIFVRPYQDATNAELYFVLKHNVIDEMPEKEQKEEYGNDEILDDQKF